MDRLQLVGNETTIDQSKQITQKLTALMLPVNIYSKGLIFFKRITVSKMQFEAQKIQ